MKRGALRRAVASLVIGVVLSTFVAWACALYSEGDEDAGPVAHVTATYSIPPERGGG